jgi:hypothetical protein
MLANIPLTHYKKSHRIASFDEKLGVDDAEPTSQCIARVHVRKGEKVSPPLA